MDAFDTYETAVMGLNNKQHRLYKRMTGHEHAQFEGQDGIWRDINGNIMACNKDDIYLKAEALDIPEQTTSEDDLPW